MSKKLLSPQSLPSFIEKELRSYQPRISQNLKRRSPSAAPIIDALLNIIATIDGDLPAPEFETSIGLTFFNDKITKRIYNLIGDLLDFVDPSRKITEPMIKNVGLTSANRIVEVSNDLEQDVYIDGRKVKRQDLVSMDDECRKFLEYIFLRMRKSGRKDLVPHYAQAIVDLCKDASFVKYVDSDLYIAVTELGVSLHTADDEGIPRPEEFPSLESLKNL